MNSLIFELPIKKNISFLLKIENLINNIYKIKKIKNYYSATIFFINISELIKLIENINIKFKLIEEFKTQTKNINLNNKKILYNVRIFNKIKNIIEKQKKKKKNNILTKDKILNKIKKKIELEKINIFSKKIPEIIFWLNLSKKIKQIFFNKWIKLIKVIKILNSNLLKIIRKINTFKKIKLKKFLFKDKIEKSSLIRIKINKRYLLYPSMFFYKDKFFIKFLSFKNNKKNFKNLSFYLSKCK